MAIQYTYIYEQMRKCLQRFVLPPLPFVISFYFQFSSLLSLLLGWFSHLLVASSHLADDDVMAGLYSPFYSEDTGDFPRVF